TGARGAADPVALVGAPDEEDDDDTEEKDERDSRDSRAAELAATEVAARFCACTRKVVGGCGGNGSVRGEMPVVVCRCKSTRGDLGLTRAAPACNRAAVRELSGVAAPFGTIIGETMEDAAPLMTAEAVAEVAEVAEVADAEAAAAAEEECVG